MNLSSKLQFQIASIVFFLTTLLYAVWSYALTDPNLVYTSWPPFWSFQQFMWQLPKQNVTIVFVMIVAVLLACSIWMSCLAEKLHFGFKKWLIIFAVITSPLIFSNNALSHDVFNYIFNARMVLKYQTNPHTEVAQQFSNDTWVRFMHNIHTPAPYFYGWTALSLLPSLLGVEKFVLTWLLFRLWSELGLVLSFVFVILLMRKQRKVDLKGFALLLFSPLLIIEIISNSHNDAWMMWPALASLYLVMRKNSNEKLSWLKIVGSLGLLLLSMSTKYATVLLVPVWLYLVFQIKVREFLAKIKGSPLKKFSINIFDLSAVLMFLPLLTNQSQQFHPWYLSWSIVFLPLMKNKFLRMSLIVLSVSSLVRYVPWMWNGAFDYTSQIELNEKLITWVPLGLFAIFWILNEGRKRIKRG